MSDQVKRPPSLGVSSLKTLVGFSTLDCWLATQSRSINPVIQLWNYYYYLRPLHIEVVVIKLSLAVMRWSSPATTTVNHFEPSRSSSSNLDHARIIVVVLVKPKYHPHPTTRTTIILWPIWLAFALTGEKMEKPKGKLANHKPRNLNSKARTRTDYY